MYTARLAHALPDIRRQIQESASRSGRSAEGVTLVAVTKGHPLPVVEACLEAGLLDLGENRVESLEERTLAFSGRGIRWHMVGHLQSRKANRAALASHLIHSVDSVRLAERLDRVGSEVGRKVSVLVQVNTAAEPAKSGLDRDTALDDLGGIMALGSLEVAGLMTMAPFTDDEGVLRDTFRRLRELHEEAGRTLSGYRGTELSMGMSNDFAIAVEEGSTMVRLGTALFGERPV
jgi:PLP dependent protein